MRNFRTVIAVAALAAIALLVPATSSQAATSTQASGARPTAQLGFDWKG